MAARRITLEELRSRIEANPDLVIVEALGPMYYEDQHLPNAINIPHTEVDELAPTLLSDKDAEIVVYCSNGPCANSGIASARLVQLGYTNVADYHEGKQEWIAAGLPTESGAAVTS
jgi:rhodanese-related sulfurtransferase